MQGTSGTIITPSGPPGFQGAPGPAVTQVSALGVNTPAGPTGVIRATGDVTAFYSDARLKTIIGPIDNPLQRLQKIEGVYYQPNDLAKSFGFGISMRNIGFIAQQIEEILPEAVRIAPFDANKFGHSKSGAKYLTVIYSKVVPLLIQALKEQKGQIDYIRSKL